MAKGYQRHSRGGSFKRQDFGDLGLRSLKDQQQQIIDSLKLQAARTKEYGTQHISQLKGIGSSEQENRNILNRLEDKAYQTRRDAIKVRAETEIDALKGEAAEYGRKADFWSDFSTTYSKEWGKLAQGARNLADYKHGLAAFEKGEREGLTDDFYSFNAQVLHKKDDVNYYIGKDTDIQTAKGNLEEAKGVNKTRLSNSENKSNIYADDFKRNSKGFIDVFKQRHRGQLSESTLDELSSNYLYSYFERIGVDPRTPGGRVITAEFNKEIRLLKNKLGKNTIYDNDQVTLEDHIKAFRGNLAIKDTLLALGFTEEEVFERNSEAFNAIVRHVRVMARKDSNENIIIPEGDQNIREAFIETIEYIRHFSPADDPIRNDLEKLLEITTPWRTLNNKDGSPSKEYYNVKHENAINDYGNAFGKRIKAEIQNERNLILGEQFLNKKNAWLAYVEKEGVADTWRTIPKYRNELAKIRDTPGAHDQLKTWINDELGWDEDKHVDWVRHNEWEMLKADPTTMNVDRLLYLFNTFPAGKQAAYQQDHANILAFVQAGGTTKNSKDFSPTLVGKHPEIKQMQTTSILHPHTIRVIEALDRHVLREFTRLSEKYKDNPGDPRRLTEAQDIVSREFDRGIKEKTGLYRIIDPADRKLGTQVIFANFDDQIDADAKVRNWVDLSDRLWGEKSEYKGSLKKAAAAGEFMSQDTAGDIAESLLIGKWDGKIPPNIKVLAQLRNWDERDALKIVLEYMGYKDLHPPVRTEDQLKNAGYNIPKNYSQKDHAALSAYYTWVKETGQTTIPRSLRNDPAYQEYLKNKEITNAATSKETTNLNPLMGLTGVPSYMGGY